MKFLLLLFLPLTLWSQTTENYNVSAENPFGKLNPEAPPETADYAPLIGSCDCKSEMRNPDQTWGETKDMTWTFKYIMNGTAVQDETTFKDGRNAGSIRQFIADSSKWYVHFYSNTGPTPKLPAWEGGMRGDSIVLYNEQKAPNGMDGYYRITFSDIDEKGFKWLGEWVNTSESFSYPTWKIDCTKRTALTDKEQILLNAKAFSEAYMRKDHEAIVNMYTSDGKIFPNKRNVMEGPEALSKFWKFRDGVKDVYHKLTPVEVTVIGNYAYDYGYYEGKITNSDDSENEFKGKYVIIWQKIDDDWKMYLDIWNSI
ncbi:MAG: nuclear transport factor 2 family protein [Flavobacteriaceae bacterium]|nr:nuclear transport factor 2 family protein [Flavobacteriaceae bacterium]